MSDTTDFYAALGRLIRDKRERAGMTQDALAASIGLTRTSVTNIEKGRQKLLLHTFCKIAIALGLPPAELLPDGAEVDAEPTIDDMLKGRPKKERDWIRSAINSSRKED